MKNVCFEAWAGRVGILASIALWVMAVPVLGRSLVANQEATGRGLYHLGRGLSGPESLHATAVAWGLLFVVLQLLAPLLLSFTLRAVYRLRMAVCLSISAGCSIALAGLELLAMLLWLRISVGVA